MVWRVGEQNVFKIVKIVTLLYRVSKRGSLSHARHYIADDERGARITTVLNYSNGSATNMSRRWFVAKLVLVGTRQP